MSWRGLFKNISLPGAFFLILGLYLAFEAVFASMGLLLVQTMLGVKDSEELQRLLFNPSTEELSDPALRFAIQLVNILAAGGKLLAGLMFLLLLDGHPLSRPGTRQRPAWIPLLLAIAAVLVSGSAIDALHTLNRDLLSEASGGWIEQMRDWEVRAERLTQALVEPGEALPMATTFLMVALLAPAWEELVFRGITQRLFEAWTRNGHLAVWTSAALFAAVHMQFLSFLPRMGLALVLGYAFLYSRNLWVPIAAHMANNTGYLLYAWLSGSTPEPADPQLLAIVGASTAVVLLIFGLYRFRDQEAPPPWVGLSPPAKTPSEPGNMPDPDQ
jgi:membrane protease YdiL (CAAX protease family)